MNDINILINKPRLEKRLDELAKEIEKDYKGKDIVFLGILKGSVPFMLSKPSRRVIELNVDYIGFQIEDKFVIGFGLDDNQNLRNLPYIGYKE